MPRTARKKSITGVYHIILRGIDKRNIFIDNLDRTRFLSALFKAKKSGYFEILGYCLMSNHVHLLVKEQESISTTIQRITVSYVQWHNNRTGRTGHLFQNRFRSEPVENETYLISVLRYIHQNPVKAGMVIEPKDYKWSSYNDYLKYYCGKNTIIDASLISSYFESKENFVEYSIQRCNESHDEFNRKNRITDDELLEKISKMIDIKKLNYIEKNERDKIIKDLYYNQHTSVRQIGRVIGISKSLVELVLKTGD